MYMSGGCISAVKMNGKPMVVNILLRSCFNVI